MKGVDAPSEGDYDEEVSEEMLDIGVCFNGLTGRQNEGICLD